MSDYHVTPGDDRRTPEEKFVDNLGEKVYRPWCDGSDDVARGVAYSRIQAEAAAKGLDPNQVHRLIQPDIDPGKPFHGYQRFVGRADHK